MKNILQGLQIAFWCLGCMFFTLASIYLVQQLGSYPSKNNFSPEVVKGTSYSAVTKKYSSEQPPYTMPVKWTSSDEFSTPSLVIPTTIGVGVVEDKAVVLYYDAKERRHYPRLIDLPIKSE